MRGQVEETEEIGTIDRETMDVQIFGIQKSADTRKALRFFKERRVNVHFVDLKVRPASKGELTRFAQKFGVETLLDRDSKRFKELGLGVAHYSEAAWLAKLVEEPLLLRMPLVRYEKLLTVGLAEDSWRHWTGT
jgi:arsenate reductase